jgi:hypothetical protein
MMRMERIFGVIYVLKNFEKEKKKKSFVACRKIVNYKNLKKKGKRSHQPD